MWTTANTTVIFTKIDWFPLQRNIMIGNSQKGQTFWATVEHKSSHNKQKWLERSNLERSKERDRKRNKTHNSERCGSWVWLTDLICFQLSTEVNHTERSKTEKKTVKNCLVYICLCIFVSTYVPLWDLLSVGEKAYIKLLSWQPNFGVTINKHFYRI